MNVGSTGRKPEVGWNHPAPPVATPNHALPSYAQIPDVSALAKLKTPASTASIAVEVFRLKKEAAKDPSLRQALIMKQAEWVTRAKAEGLTPPTGPLDPFRSSPKEIINAFLWSEAGGVVPREELERDGGKAFQTSIRDAVVLRMRGFDALMSLHEGEPEVQRGFLAQELARRGVKVPEGADLVSMRALYAESSRSENCRRPTIGLDGRTGTAESVDSYERQEGIDAMNPGTTLGSLMATFSVVATGEVDVDRMRAMGNAGNAAEGMLGGSAVHLNNVEHQHEPPGTVMANTDDFNRIGLKPKFQVKAMDPHYVGEEMPGNEVWNKSQPSKPFEVKYANRPTDRAPFKLQPREAMIDGKKEVRLFDADGNLFDTRNAATHEGNARAIFVMNAQGEIFASTFQEAAYMHHSSLSGGEPVAAAGELIVENGKVIGITNKSGHYRPEAKYTEQLITSLRSQGVDLAGVTVTTIPPPPPPGKPIDPFAMDVRVLK